MRDIPDIAGEVKVDQFINILSFQESILYVTDYLYVYSRREAAEQERRDYELAVRLAQVRMGVIFVSSLTTLSLSLSPYHLSILSFPLTTSLPPPLSLSPSLPLSHSMRLSRK